MYLTQLPFLQYPMQMNFFHCQDARQQYQSVYFLKNSSNQSALRSRALGGEVEAESITLM